MKILAIETSCDETSIAVVENGTNVLSHVVSSSSGLFYETGGVVPEVAARAQLEYILPVFNKALNNSGLKINDIDVFAVTVGPGLIGSLFVGVTFAKTLSLIFSKPVIPVNHLLGHIYSVFIKTYLGDEIQNKSITYPSLSLVVSGGHTDLVLLRDSITVDYLGGTRDDAAGESFDKVARILDIEKYLGGPKLSKIAKDYIGNGTLKFPRPLINDGTFEFSFSGLKTAVIREKDNYKIEELAFEFEKAVCETLVEKTKKAIEKYSPSSVILCGGVSANSTLREMFINNFNNVFIPPIYLSTDNASMVGAAAYAFKHLATNELSKVNANPSLSLQNLF